MNIYGASCKLDIVTLTIGVLLFNCKLEFIYLLFICIGNKKKRTIVYQVPVRYLEDSRTCLKLDHMNTSTG
jgi:hypothetical protein